MMYAVPPEPTATSVRHGRQSVEYKDQAVEARVVGIDDYAQRLVAAIYFRRRHDTRSDVTAMKRPDRSYKHCTSNSLSRYINNR